MSVATHHPLTLEPKGERHGLGGMVSGLVGSEILKIAGEVRTLVRAGKPVCNLTVGDFAPREFRIPEVLDRAIAAAYAKGETNYPPADGVLALREAVQAFYRRALGLAYPLEGILIAGGARPLIYGAYRSLLDHGDTVVYPVPSWNNNHYVHLCGARGVAVRARSHNGFQPTAEALAPHLRDAKLLVINSPLNPAGTGFSRDEMRAIAELVVEENARRGAGEAPLFLLYDQIYWMLAAESAPHFTPVGLVPEVAPYTVFVDGISKAFAATGLRVGWAVGPPYIVRRLADLLGHVGAWAPRPEQVATAQIFLDDGIAERAAEAVRDGALLRLRALHDGLARLGAEGLPVRALPPAGAIYLSAQFNLIDRLGSNEAIRKLLLDEAGFAMVPFQAFGLDEENGWFRLSVGAVSVEEIEAALPRVAAALQRFASA
jgi:aspartate aminotransferase